MFSSVAVQSLEPVRERSAALAAERDGRKNEQGGGNNDNRERSSGHGLARAAGRESIGPRLNDS